MARAVAPVPCVTAITRQNGPQGDRPYPRQGDRNFDRPPRNDQAAGPERDPRFTPPPSDLPAPAQQPRQQGQGYDDDNYEDDHNQAGVSHESGFARPNKRGGFGGGGGQGGRNRSNGAGAGAAPGGQPDPMKTSMGYIGADSFLRQRREGAGGGRSGGGGGGGATRGGRGPSRGKGGTGGGRRG